jgi:acyl carrier protein
VNEEVLEVIRRFIDPPGDPAAPLELTSLELVQLAEALEERFGFVVAARELSAANFGTAALIAEFVERKRSAP